MFHRKSMWMVTVLVLIALATMGVGYAYWSSTLAIEGTVNTGAVDAAWVAEPPPTAVESGDPDSFATCVVEVQGEALDTLVFTIENGYPGYTCTINAAFTNTGTVPWRLGREVLTFADEEAIDVDFTPETPSCSTGTVYNPGQTVFGGLIITVLEGAEQGATYTGSYTFELVQWDEWTIDLCIETLPLPL